ncbi:MAG: hypothetical protein BGO54_16585 [Sphingobacteriales bacterium 46-32]|nr:MAG: hypothetical protein BGO54_16585 [Sphingobacteriales bacterium 46-32]
MQAVKKFIDKDFGHCSVLYESKAFKTAADICIFASHTYSPALPEYVYEYLDSIKAAGIDIVFISTASVSIVDLPRLSTFSVCIIERENIGTDFGSWCTVLRYLGCTRYINFLYLCNDSVFGPFIPFASLHDQFKKVGQPVMGITDSHQGVAYHIQSYFVGIKPLVSQSNAWISFWTELKLFTERSKIIEHYEIGFSTMLRTAGFEFYIWSDWTKTTSFESIVRKVAESKSLRSRWLEKVLYNNERIIRFINPCALLWKELMVHHRFPFLKRELLIYEHLFEEFELDEMWMPVFTEKKLTYPINLIRFFLVDYFLHRALPALFTDLGKVSYASAAGEETREKLVKRIYNREDPTLFDYIESLASERRSLPAFEADNEILQEFGIRILPVEIITEQKGRFPVSFIYIDERVARGQMSDLNRVRVMLKKLPNPLVIVPSEGMVVLVSHLLQLREGGIMTEKEFLYPINRHRVKEIFYYIFSMHGHGSVASFSRPSLAAVVNDALGNNRHTNFLNTNGVVSDQAIPLFAGQIPLLENRDKYLQIKQMYFEVYEKTPGWYKKLGHLIKLMQGNKRIKIKLVEKGGKENYKETPEDISQWYHIQYEVLPKWYKRFGEKLIKK